MTTGTVDTERFSEAMRRRGVDRDARTLRITNFAGSEQEQDFTEPANCDGFGRVRHFRRETSEGWPPNPLPIDPAARALGLRPAPAMLEAQVFQNAVCNWRCWYCFVDFDLLSGSPERSRMLSADELIALYQADPRSPAMIDLTGGQPDLVPEWVPWMIEALERAGLDRSVYLWSDDNLSNDYSWRYLSAEERSRVEGYEMYGKVCCFKGFDRHSFACNTAAAPELLDRQLELMGRLLRETTIDLYAYATFTTDEPDGIDSRMADFVDRLQELDPVLPLRTVPLEIAAFTPVGPRMTVDRERALELQIEAVAAWNSELTARFNEADLTRSICDVSLRS
jgi:organic radical activating enzyme